MSGETKFTAGPWQTKPSRINGDVGIWHPGDANVLAECFEDIQRDNERDATTALANAHLIAASPELYAALEALKNEVMGLEAAQLELTEFIGVTNFNCLMRRAGEAMAALAKARGESQ